jgi:hypothetical protein
MSFLLPRVQANTESLPAVFESLVTFTAEGKNEMSFIFTLYALTTGLLRRRDTFRLTLTLKMDISVGIVLKKKCSVFRILSSISEATLTFRFFE